LGDIFISPSDVAAKAAVAGNSVRAQMTWTVVHGLLHLAGYDHEKNSAVADKMFALERKLLKKLSA
jgi:probable rRNA maturation factor